MSVLLVVLDLPLFSSLRFFPPRALFSRKAAEHAGPNSPIDLSALRMGTGFARSFLFPSPLTMSPCFLPLEVYFMPAPEPSRAFPQDPDAWALVSTMDFFSFAYRFSPLPSLPQ